MGITEGEMVEGSVTDESQMAFDELRRGGLDDWTRKGWRLGVVDILIALFWQGHWKEYLILSKYQTF